MLPLTTEIPLAERDLDPLSSSRGVASILASAVRGCSMATPRYPAQRRGISHQGVGKRRSTIWRIYCRSKSKSSSASRSPRPSSTRCRTWAPARRAPSPSRTSRPSSTNHSTSPTPGSRVGVGGALIRDGIGDADGSFAIVRRVAARIIAAGAYPRSHSPFASHGHGGRGGQETLKVCQSTSSSMNTLDPATPCYPVLGPIAISAVPRTHVLKATRVRLCDWFEFRSQGH